MNNADFYRTLLDLLQRNSLEHLVRGAAGYLHQHVTVLDTGYRVLASWPQEQLGDPFWDAQQTLGYVPEENLHRIFLNKYPDATFTGTTYIDWGDVVIPRCVSTLTYENRSLGHVSIYHTDPSLSRKDLEEAVECLASVLRVFFLSHDLISSTNEVAMSSLFTQLFSGHVIDWQFRDQWQKFSTYALEGNYVVISIEQKELHHSVMELIRSRLKTVHKYTASVEQERYCYILFYQIASPKHWKSIVSRLSDYFRSYHIHCGISQLFSSLDMLKSYMYQSRRALKLGGKICPGGTTYNYMDLQAYSMLDYIAENVEPVNFKHELLQNLERDDEQNGTQYYETLITYLNCICNSAEAALYLSIHRNTLLYRIKHIEEYYDYDLSDSHTLRELALSAMICTYSRERQACEKSQTEDLQI